LDHILNPGGRLCAHKHQTEALKEHQRWLFNGVESKMQFRNRHARYTQLVTFEDDDYTCKAAANVKDATELIEAGYEYVCDMDNIKLFRKRK
jgi:hypothetical protein